jgi:hypothetical protein
MDAHIIFHGILWKVARSTKDVAASPNQDGLRSEQEWRRVVPIALPEQPPPTRESPNMTNCVVWQGIAQKEGQDHWDSAWWWGGMHGRTKVPSDRNGISEQRVDES